MTPRILSDKKVELGNTESMKNIKKSWFSFFSELYVFYVWRRQLLLIGQTINSNNRINQSNHSWAKQPHLTRLLILKGKGSQSESIVSNSPFSFTLGRLQQRCGLGQGAAHLLGADDHGNPGSEWYVIIIYEAPAHGTITDSFLAFIQFLQQPKIARNHNFKQRQTGLMKTHPWAQSEDNQTWR